MVCIRTTWPENGSWYPRRRAVVPLPYPILGRSLFELVDVTLVWCHYTDEAAFRLHVLNGNVHGSPLVQLVYISDPLMYFGRHAELYVERTVDSWQRWCLRAKIAPSHSRMMGIEMYGCFPLENRACASSWIFSMPICMCIYAVSVMYCMLWFG